MHSYKHIKSPSFARLYEQFQKEEDEKTSTIPDTKTTAEDSLSCRLARSNSIVLNRAKRQWKRQNSLSKQQQQDLFENHQKNTVSEPVPAKGIITEPPLLATAKVSSPHMAPSSLTRETPKIGRESGEESMCQNGPFNKRGGDESPGDSEITEAATISRRTSSAISCPGKFHFLYILHHLLYIRFSLNADSASECNITFNCKHTNCKHHFTKRPLSNFNVFIIVCFKEPISFGRQGT